MYIHIPILDSYLRTCGRVMGIIQDRQTRAAYCMLRTPLSASSDELHRIAMPLNSKVRSNKASEEKASYVFNKTLFGM